MNNFTFLTWSTSFGNNSPTTVKGKGIVLLKEKVKARNGLFIDELKQKIIDCLSDLWSREWGGFQIKGLCGMKSTYK